MEDRRILRERYFAFIAALAVVVVVALAAAANAADDGKAGNTKHAIPNNEANNESRHCIACVPP